MKDPKIAPYDNKVRRHKGGIKTWIQYYGEDDRAALCISRDQDAGKSGCWVIANEQLCMYAESNGNHSKYMELWAPKIAAFIGLGSDKHDAFIVAEAVLDRIDEAYTFLPPTYSQSPPDTEVSLTINGETFTSEI